MLKEISFCYFSPAGTTKKAGEMFCNAIAENVHKTDFAKAEAESCTAETAVIAVPVFAGRIPDFTVEKIKALNGSGRKAVTVVVYGNRAYDDALLELNTIVAETGFDIVASAALVAQHSMVNMVAEGRPDTADEAEIKQFAAKVLDKLNSGTKAEIKVPGNFPYRDGMKVSATPISTDNCGRCGICAEICPTKAITTGENVETELSKCILCVACIANCPSKCRILPPPMQEGMNQKLGPLKDIRRENEYFV